MNLVDPTSPRVVVLAGGVGGARLADGLARVLPPQSLTVVVNTGDDFRHLGLTICPDLDTVTYTLGGVANDETGWGRAGESRRAMDEVGRLGGPDWFSLGDLDLATHLTRAQGLEAGETLTAVTRRLCQGFGIGPAVLPMSDQPAPTLIETDTGEILPFQVWFVRERWQPVVRRVVLPEDARATAEVVRALETADVVIIAPSNPFVSIDPILNVYPIRAMIEDVPRAVVAVSPIIDGRAVKGPAAKMMAERGLEPSAASVAAYYGHLIDGFIYDSRDAGMAAEDGLALLCTDTMMTGATERERLAREVLGFVENLFG
ncbi:MAG: 2-phospho-L-lactate transferase [Candidatus Promineofilum sp.]|nr:2-phospho-L-lactate transferase [Promineifilum sp.]